MNKFIAQINNNTSICEGMTILQKVPNNNDTMSYLEVPDGFDCMWRKYEDGAWSDERYPPPEPPKPLSDEEKRLMSLSEALATMYEESMEKDIEKNEVLATIYEAIVGAE